MRELQPLAVGHAEPLPGEWATGPFAQLAPRPPMVAATFRTRQLADLPPMVRTIGVVCHFGAAPPQVVADQIVRPNLPSSPLGCARGKMAVAMRQDDQCHAACYQLSDCQTQVIRAACGNTAAAVAALEARLSGTREVALRVELANQARIQVTAQLSPVGPDASQVVHQTWWNVPLQLRDEGLVAGHHCATCVGPLNNYLIIRARPGEDPADLSVPEALAWWRRFGLDQQPLLSRMVVVQPHASPLPSVKFFTCGDREHPSAPLTGLAVLALAARQFAWLKLGSSEVTTPAGPMTLPRIHPAAAGITIEFPAVVVELDY